MKKTLFMIATGLLMTALMLQAAPPMGVQSAANDAPAGMALIPSGNFWMGRNHSFLFDELNWVLRPRLDDRPVHELSMDAFYMDKYEVTNADYERFVTAKNYEKPWHWPGGKVTAQLAKLPVYNVSWNDAEAYCAWAGKRLPSEAEWEKAGRGGLVKQLYEWGEDLTPPKPKGAAGAAAGAEAEDEGAGKHAHYGNAIGPATVGSFPPNGYGLYDMTGNVWEWVNDWYAKDYYLNTADKNPQGPEKGTYKVARGGGWSSTEDIPQRSILGVHYRNYADPTQTSNVLGFRCAKNADVAPKAP